MSEQLQRAARDFLAWFETFEGKAVVAEINCEELTALRAALDPPAMVSRWCCPACKSRNVQISLPHWFYESQDNELIPVEVDGEADISWWYCEDCDETDSGSPEEVEI